MVYEDLWYTCINLSFGFQLLYLFSVFRLHEDMHVGVSRSRAG